jgi:hypothetical protein
MRKFLKKHGIPFDRILQIKPPACFIIDDRAIHHTSWKSTMNTITARESIGGIDEEDYSDEELRNADA